MSIHARLPKRVLVLRTRRTRIILGTVAFLDQGPCEPDVIFLMICFTCNPEVTVSTTYRMGDRKPGSRGFRAGLTGFSAVRTTDVEENQDQFVLPDFYWVLRPMNPAHVPDDSKAGNRGFTWKTPTGSVVKTVMKAGELPPIVLSPVQSVTSTLLRRAVRSRRCTWNAPGKLLYLACPVSVGSLKLAITVQTAVDLFHALQEKVVVDLEIEFPGDLLLELLRKVLPMRR